tara:strand:+ start:2127 stop:2486 length:360 start_codon:yes stop_codon:yes gene_type:complete
VKINQQTEEKPCEHFDSFVVKKSFLGFQKHVCVLCKAESNDSSVPLGTGYRITYWVIGLLFVFAFLAELPKIIQAATLGPSIFIYAIVEQWVFILFIVGAVFALKKDAAIRKRNQFSGS